MSFVASFVGGFYQSLSPIAASDQAINVYMETRKIGDSAKQVTLYGTPGLKLLATVGTLGSRGMFAQDGRTWVVVGDTLYERTGATAFTSRGTIPDDGNGVSFASNGRGGDQLGIVGGGQLNVLDLNTNVLTPVVLPFSNPVMMAFLDGYGLINEASSPIVWFSALEDFTVWDPIDFFTRSGTSDNIVGITVSRDRVWCLGSKTTTLFYDSGDTDTPFVPYPGTTMQVGLVSPSLLQVYADQIIWVASIAKGQLRVVLATDAAPQVISTPPIDLWLENATTLLDGEMLIYQQEGHTFACITSPTADGEIKTYGFDLAEGQWSARAGFDTASGQYLRWRAQASTQSENDVLVGDYETGDIYTLELDTYLDNGLTIKRERTTPFLANDASNWLFLDQVELGIQAGVGLISGTDSDPMAQLDISRNGGQTWVYAGLARLGKLGQYFTRCIWRRLGRTRSDLLVLRVTQTAAVKTVWTGIWVRTQQGSNQL